MNTLISMDVYTFFRQYIYDKVTISSTDWQRIYDVAEEIVVEEQAHILQEGETCRHLYFLHQGLLRYYVWKDGEEKTKFFTPANQLFTSPQSFSLQQPSLENIQTLAPSQLLRIHYDQVQTLYELVPAWSKFIRLILLEVSHWTDELLQESQQYTAHERYQLMLEHEPELIRQVPLKYLASYLGIAPESLSRIRKKIRSYHRN